MARPSAELRWAAEKACGDLRQVAEHLQEIADALPQRDHRIGLSLRLEADRLAGVAVLLAAEAAVEQPATARTVAGVGRTVLVGVAALLGTVGGGAAEGAASAIVEQAISASASADKALVDVGSSADRQEGSERGLRDRLDLVLLAVQEEVEVLLNEDDAGRHPAVHRGLLGLRDDVAALREQSEALGAEAYWRQIASVTWALSRTARQSRSEGARSAETAMDLQMFKLREVGNEYGWTPPEYL